MSCDESRSGISDIAEEIETDVVMVGVLSLYVLARRAPPAPGLHASPSYCPSPLIEAEIAHADVAGNIGIHIRAIEAVV